MAIKIQNPFSIKFSEFGFIKHFLLIIVVFYGYKDTTAQLNLNGVLQNYLAAQTIKEHEFIAARNRLRLQAERSTVFGGVTTELDIIHIFKGSQDIELLLKEAYMDWFLEKHDLRLGHQKIIWGRTNGAFVTDIVTPVDLREFLTVSAEDIRFGITAFNALRYFGLNSLQFVAAPFFQPDLLPSSDSRWFPASELRSAFSPIPVTTSREDKTYSLKDVQLALRYSLLSPEYLDLDFLLMRWTHPAPAYDISLDLTSLPDIPSVNLVESYQNSWMGGISVSLRMHQKLFFLTETLFVKKKLFNINPFGQEIDIIASDGFATISELLPSVELNNHDFLISKPWIHSMAGLRTEFFKTTIDAQFYLEGILNYEDQILQEKTYKYVTLLSIRSFLRDRLQLLTLSRYNIDTEDFWIQFQGQYELNDNLQLSLGTNLFGGDKDSELSGHLSFSQFQKNSFIFSKIALFF